MTCFTLSTATAKALNKHSKVTIAILAISLFLPIAGCSNSGKDLSKNADGSDTHEHYPKHWPGTIFVAAERLVQLSRSEATDSKQFGVPVEKEFIDLVRWLPELVADSDLSEQVFNDVDNWSNQYSTLLVAEQASGKSIADLSTMDGLAGKMESLLEACRAETTRLSQLGER